MFNKLDLCSMAKELTMVKSQRLCQLWSGDKFLIYFESFFCGVIGATGFFLNFLNNLMKKWFLSVENTIF